MIGNGTFFRIRRLFFKFGNSETQYHQVVGEGGKFNFGSSPTTNVATSPFQPSLRIASNAIHNVITGFEGVISTPFRWLKEIQDNMFIYMVIAMVILITILILYCVIRRHLFTPKINIKWPAAELPSIPGAVNNKAASTKWKLPFVTGIRATIHSKH